MKKRKYIKRFKKVKPGDWVQPRIKNYFMQCCDCGLIHRLNFRLHPDGNGGFHIQFQAFRAKRGWR